MEKDRTYECENYLQGLDEEHKLQQTVLIQVLHMGGNTEEKEFLIDSIFFSNLPFSTSLSFRP